MNCLSRKQIRLSTYLLLSSVSFATFAFAQNNNIVVDTAAHQGAGAPNIVQSSNGTDVLNIVKPTTGGVSHNKFLEYNVNESNLILNNHAYKTGIPQGESTLGGTVAFNPNFGTGDAARVILNEVTSNSTTALEGYTEIFGQRAALVIANPNGITAAGAGFINLSRLTMVTGKPNVVDGKLQDFAISPVGTISIEGKGEQAFGLHVPESPAELVSNAVKVAGNIYVDEDQELTIKTGNDKYDYNTKQVTSKNDTTTQPTLALDSSALGGMYAGRIKIEATQSGMGIKTDGNLVADMDNLEITADGDIVFKNVAAKNNIKVASKSGVAEHKKEGIAHAEKDLTITAGKDVALNGTSYASNNISAQAKENIGVQGTAFAENNINLTAQKDVTLEGEFVLSDTLNVKAGQNLTSAMQVAAVKNADITAGKDLNLTKEFINADTINIEAKNNLTNDGKLVADTDLTMNVGKNLTNNDTILAQNTATIEVGGNSLLNSGSVSAKNLSLTSGSLTNNAQIATDETLTLNTTGDITNNSKINAGTDASLSADNIHNLGQIAANGNINISTKNDYVNHRDSGLLAGADIIIESGKDIINYLAEIFAGNNIELKGKDAKIGNVDPNKVYDNPNVENKHTSTSAADNTQDIQNGEFDEDDDGLDITLTDLNKTITVPADAFAEEPNLGDSYTLDGYTIYIGERIVTPPATPDGEPTITFQNADKLTILDENGNEVAYTLWDDVESGGENIDTSDKTDEKTSETIKDQITNTPFTASLDQFNALVNLGGRIESFNDITIKSDKLYNMGLNHNTGSDAYSTYYDKIRDKAPYNAGWLELGRYKISEVHLDAEAATILAGHNLNINSRDILNQSSTLSAKNNAVINTAQLKNQTYSEVVKLAIKKQRRTKKKKHFRTKKKTYNATEYYNERIYSNEASLVTAGNNLIINASGGNVVNDQVEAATGSFRFGRDEVPDLKSGQVPVDLTLPRGDNGMFAVSEGDPKYMIRSNVDFFNNIPFVGSDYFFDRITPFSNEYNTRKMLGDPAYETRLIMDAIRQATYGHYLGNGEISNDLDQMKALYNNAAKEYERLDLKIGIALTAEQVAQLNTDIIWYVEKEVNGEKVLVPELYLCQATLDDIKIGGYGAKMTGKNIAINADNISNSGDIFAKNELALKAKNLLNESNRAKTARIIGGRTDIEADTLINRSATIGGEVTTIKANDILNETKKYTEETRRGKNYDLIEKTGQEAVISGDKGLQIEANGTYASKGAKLESKEGDVSLKAENIILDTVELHNREERSKTKSGFMSKKTTKTVKDSRKNIGSTIVAGGNALIGAVKDIFSKGSKVEAGKDAIVVAGGDVNVVAATDHNYSYSQTRKSSLGGLKKSVSTNEAYEEKLRGSNLQTKDGLAIKSGGNTNIVSSNVIAGSDLIIDTGKNLNVISGVENSYTKSSKNKNSMLSSSVQEKVTVTGTNVSSNIMAGNDLLIKTEENINSIGTNFAAGNEATLNAKKDVNLINATDYVYDYNYTRKEKTDLGAVVVGAAAGAAGGSAFGTAGMVSGAVGGAMGGANAKKGHEDIVITYDEKTVNGSIVAGKININSNDNTNIISNTLIADEINVNAGKNLNIGSAQEIHTSYEKHEKFNVDYAGVATGAAVGGVVSGMMGQAGASVGSFIGGTAGETAGYIIGTTEGIQTQAAATEFAGQVLNNNKNTTTNIVQQSSDLIASDNINLNSHNNVAIVGSNVVAGKEVNINSETGDVIITSAEELHSSSSSHEKRKGTDISFLNGTTGDKVKSGVNIATIEKGYNENKENSNIISQKGTIVASGDNMNITSGHNLTVAGSVLNAEKDLNIHADNEVNIQSTENKLNLSSDNKTGKISLDMDIANNFLVLADETAKTVEVYSESNDDTASHVNQVSQTGNTGIAAYNAVMTIGSLGFTGKATATVSYTEDKSNASAITHNASELTSTQGNINISTGKSDINIKGSHLAANDDINLTSGQNGNVNISSTVDNMNTDSKQKNTSISESLDLGTGMANIPTISTGKTKSTHNETTNNNSTLNSHEGGININSSENIDIAGANLSAEKDIMLNAENGDVNISSTQDTLSSKTKGNDYSLGGTIGFGVNKDTIETVTNNLTTLDSKTGEVKIATNDLTLTEINKDNLNIENVKGNITEDHLFEKDEHDMYDMGLSFNAPIGFKVMEGLNPTDENNIQPDKSGQSIIQVGDWKGAVLNTHISYKDDNGYDLDTTLGGIIAPSIWVKDAIESYTGHKMTWVTGNSAVYKAAENTYDSLNPNANNIGNANVTNDKNLQGTPVEFKGWNYIKNTREGSFISQVANLIPGMNAMAVFHDKWADKGLMSNSPYLQASIFPAIPITYIGLIFGGTSNDLGIEINSDDLKQQNTDRLSVKRNPTTLKEYMEQQKNELQILKDKYVK